MMRWLLALLLLANLGLFLWAQTQVTMTQSRPKNIEIPSGVQKILLLREKEQTQSQELELELEMGPEKGDPPDVDSYSRADSNEDTEEAQLPEYALEMESPVSPALEDEPEPAPICGRIGPYADIAATEKIRDELTGAAVSADLSQTTEQIQTGYWVLIPALPNRHEANQVVKELKEAGVTDLWLFTKGPMANSISLGMYAGIKNATRHSNNIKQKGFNAEVSPKLSEKTRYWLDYRADDEKMLGTLLGELSAELTNDKKACD